MPPAGATYIRIYCICGQKMRVSSAMLGRNGKCVACRQKIRIPRLDELPPGQDAVYLKEHKEFLRRPTPLPQVSAEDAPQPPVEPEEVALGEEPGQVQAVALDALPALQRLCSLEYRIEKHLEPIRKGMTRSVAGHDKATLMRYRSLVRQARSSLDEELRQRLMEITDQLTETTSEIARDLVSLRLGEMTYANYLARIVPLRQRRERLELRQQNVRGWLATSDPFKAGRLLDIRLEDVPVEPMEVTFTLEPKAERPLVYAFVEALRESLTQRDELELRAGELRRMHDEGGLDPGPEANLRGENEASLSRARAAVAFYRVRLEQCIHDCDQDHQALLAHMEVLRKRGASGKLDRPHLEQEQMVILKAQQDLMNARDLAHRAVAANTAVEVPEPTGTLIERLTRDGARPTLGLDSWVAMAASVVMIVNIVIPISNAQIGGNRVISGEAALGLFITALLLAISAYIGRRDLRGTIICMLWSIACVVGAFHVHESWYSQSAIGEAMRLDPNWYSAPGVVLLFLSALTMGAAGALALLPARRYRRIPLVAALVTTVTVATILTDFWGVAVPKPVIEAPQSVLRDARTASYDVDITIRNDGWRTFWLGGNAAQVPSPYQFILEKQIGHDSWTDMGRPDDGKLSRDLDVPEALSRVGTEMTPVPPAKGVRMRYVLEPGAYRIQLLKRLRGLENFEARFVLAETAPPVEPPAPEPLPTPAYPAAEPESLPAAPATQMEINLRGILQGSDSAPRFVLEMRLPDGTLEQRRVDLGGVVHGDWIAREFNPAYKSLTLSNGTQLLVLESGTPLLLDVSK
jgi:hypothetical protein